MSTLVIFIRGACACCGAACERTSSGGAAAGGAPHGSLTATVQTLAGARTADERYVQTPKAKWTYLRVAAGTGRARYLNEVPGGAARAGGAASPRGSGAAPPAPRARAARSPPAPLSWALISPRPGYSIKGCSVHLAARATGRASRPVAEPPPPVRTVFECSSLSPLYSRFSYWAPGSLPRLRYLNFSDKERRD